MGGSLVGDGSVRVTGVASLADASATDVSLYADPRYRRELASTKAGALVTRESLPGLRVPQMLRADPFLARPALVDLFHPRPSHPPGIDSRALVSPTARIGTEVTVQPFVYIGDGASVGARTLLYPGV
ncbi:MAG TPA: LpxD N-terminal domain-containing protein, partial [Vicinamibacteria bacterium]